MVEFNKTYITLEELDAVTSKQQVIVRLIRKWEARNPRKGNQLMSLDLLLLDEKYNLIKASINHRLIGKFKHVLQEGSIIHIKDFDVGKSNEKFKLTDHKYIIYFNHLTSANEVLADAPIIEKTKFRFQDYENLLRLADSNDELPDVIGKLDFILGANLRDRESKQKIMASLLLENGIKVRLSVWENIASDFRAFLLATNMKKSVVVITAVNPKIFSGELYLNTTSATTFHLNNDLKDINKYFSRQEMNSCNNSPLDERELDPINYGMSTISQMLSFLDSEEPQEKSFYCKATIVGVETKNGWNYISCSKCFKKLIKEENHLFCPQCDDTNVIGIVRFRLEVMVDDNTNGGIFIIFDKDGRNLTNTLAGELISIENLDSEKEDPLPPCIVDLIGRIFVFEVIVKPFDFKSRYKTFTVSRIINECFDTQDNPAEEKNVKENKCCIKEIVRNPKHYVKRIKKEEGAITLEEKKEIKNRGKRVKRNP